jgi:hypothetical protein
VTMEDAVRALEICQARVDVLHKSLSAVVGVLAQIGGYLTPEQQNALGEAHDALGVRPRTKTWRDRV